MSDVFDKALVTRYAPATRVVVPAIGETCPWTEAAITQGLFVVAVLNAEEYEVGTAIAVQICGFNRVVTAVGEAAAQGRPGLVVHTLGCGEVSAVGGVDREFVISFDMNKIEITVVVDIDQVSTIPCAVPVKAGYPVDGVVESTAIV